MIAINQTWRDTLPARSAIAALALALTLMTTSAAWPQATPPPPPAAAPPAASPPAAAQNPGLLNEIGKMLSKPSSLLPSFGAPAPAEAPAPQAGEAPAEPPAVRPPASKVETPAARPPGSKAEPPAAPPAVPAATPSALGVPAMVTGRASCPVAANGAADCKTGSVILCVNKGYKDGKGLAIDTVEKCSAKLLIPGRARQSGDCKTEYYVTRALCQ